jgi:hypothetical protein
MSNVKISALPSTTATTLNDWVIKNNSGETTTNKVQLKNMLGLQKGTGNKSLKSANFLTTNPSNAPYLGSVAIGDNANAEGEYCVAIGTDIISAGGQRDHYIGIGGDIISAQESIAIGYDTEVVSAFAVGVGHRQRLFSDYGIAIGDAVNLRNYNQGQIGIGYQADCDGIGAVAMGYQTTAKGDYSTALGSIADATGDFSVAVGRDADAVGIYSIKIGQGDALSANTISIGHLTNATATDAIVIGSNSSANHQDSVVLGESLSSNYANTLKSRSIQTTGQFFNGVQQLGSGTNFNINWNDGGSVEFTLTGNGTCIMTNVRDGAIYRVKVNTTGNYIFTPTASGYTFIYQGGGFNLTNNGTDLCILHVFGNVVMVTHFANFS